MIWEQSGSITKMVERREKAESLKRKVGARGWEKERGRQNCNN